MNKKVGIGVVVLCAIVAGFFQVSITTGAPEPASVPTPSPSSVPFPVILYLIISVAIGAITGAVIASAILWAYHYPKQKSRQGERCKKICNKVCEFFYSMGPLGVFGLILLIVGISGTIIFTLYYKSYISYISMPIAITSMGISIIAIAIASKSERRMEALTNLNFYEKMAMLEGYKIDLKDDPSKGLENSKKCKYDIAAVAELKEWADYKKVKELKGKIREIREISQKIIEDDPSKDTEGSYAGLIEEIYESSLEIDPENDAL